MSLRQLDCLVEMLVELRMVGRSIPFLDADRREPWFDAMAQLVVELRFREQRIAWAGLIALDLGDRVPCPYNALAVYVKTRLGIQGDRGS